MVQIVEYGGRLTLRESVQQSDMAIRNIPVIVARRRRSRNAVGRESRIFIGCPIKPFAMTITIGAFETSKSLTSCRPG